MVCVGLAQNFAALRALAIEGIQNGHMKLHGRTIAKNAGVPDHLITQACEYMTIVKKYDEEACSRFLDLYMKPKLWVSLIFVLFILISINNFLTHDNYK